MRIKNSSVHLRRAVAVLHDWDDIWKLLLPYGQLHLMQKNSQLHVSGASKVKILRSLKIFELIS